MAVKLKKPILSINLRVKTLCRSAKRNSLRLFSFCILILIITDISASEILVGEYNVRFKNYTGRGTIHKMLINDTLNIIYKFNVFFGSLKVENNAKLDFNDLKPIRIDTEYTLFGKRRSGKIIFEDSVSYYYDEKNSKKVKGGYEVNDWVILPVFFQYYDNDVYECTLLKGDYIFRKSIKADTVLWKSDKDNMIIKYIDNVPVVFHGGDVKFSVK